MGKNNVNETVNEVKDEVTDVTAEVTTEVEEKKGFLYKVGYGIGKAASSVATVAKSKPAKIAGVVLIAAGAAKAGYEFGKNGSINVPKLGNNSADVDATVVSEESSSAD